MICIDPQFKSRWCFNGAIVYHDVFKINMENHNLDKKQLKYYKKTSSEFFDNDMKDYLKKINVVYIDGSHEYDDAFLDIVNCDVMLKKNGIMIIDDYDKQYADPKTKDPSKWCDGVKKAVDEFLENNTRYEVLHRRYQIILKKIK